MGKASDEIARLAADLSATRPILQLATSHHSYNETTTQTRLIANLQAQSQPARGSPDVQTALDAAGSAGRRDQAAAARRRELPATPAPPRRKEPHAAHTNRPPSDFTLTPHRAATLYWFRHDLDEIPEFMRRSTRRCMDSRRLRPTRSSNCGATGAYHGRLAPLSASTTRRHAGFVDPDRRSSRRLNFPALPDAGVYPGPQPRDPTGQYRRKRPGYRRPETFDVGPSGEVRVAVRRDPGQRRDRERFEQSTSTAIRAGSTR